MGIMQCCTDKDKNRIDNSFCSNDSYNDIEHNDVFHKEPEHLQSYANKYQYLLNYNLLLGLKT